MVHLCTDWSCAVLIDADLYLLFKASCELMCIMHRWVEEYHVDGFRFDLASCLCRDAQGNPLEAPPIIRDIAKDPVLSKVSSNTHLTTWRNLMPNN